MTTESFTVPAPLAGERVDRAVALLTGWSRAEVQALVDAGSVLVDGRPVSKSHRLAEGDEVELTAEPPDTDTLPVAEPVPFEVAYEDASVVVVRKPAGLVVHPGAGHATGTLVSGLLYRYPEIAKVGDPARPGIVHRLDRDTSGLLVAARTPAAYEGLVAALTAREVDRRYQALAWGHFDNRRGTIDAPIGRSTSRRTKMAVRDEGREARTGYEVLRQYDEPVLAHLELRLETGRTHQIRVHLSAIGHPVVGDASYGGDRQLGRVLGVVSERLDRPFLHAWRLAFDHPETGARIECEDPLPPDLQALLDVLGP